MCIIGDSMTQEYSSSFFRCTWTYWTTSTIHPTGSGVSFHFTRNVPTLKSFNFFWNLRKILPFFDQFTQLLLCLYHLSRSLTLDWPIGCKGHGENESHLPCILLVVYQLQHQQPPYVPTSWWCLRHGETLRQVIPPHHLGSQFSDHMRPCGNVTPQP